MRAMIRKEFAQLRRDHRTVAMLVVVPLLMLVVFGYAARFEVETARTVVLGSGAEQAAQRLPDVLEVREVLPSGDRATAVERLQREDVDVAVLTDEGTVLVDGTQLFAAQSVARQLAGGRGDAAASPPAGAASRVEILFNPDLDTPTIMVPALVGLIMLFIGALATSLGVVRERQDGTMEQLAVLPLSPADLFVGKLAPYLAIAVLDLTIIVSVGLTLFDVPFAGSWVPFTIGAAIFLFVSLSIGVLISTVSENQGQAVQLSLMTLLPQVMLSGLIFPVDSMAQPLQWVAAVLPLTWFIQIARGVMVRGTPFGELLLPLGVLVAMGAVVFAAAVRRFAHDLAPAGGTA